MRDIEDKLSATLVANGSKLKENSNGNTHVSIRGARSKLECLPLKTPFSILGVSDGGPQVIDGRSYLGNASASVDAEDNH